MKFPQKPFAGITVTGARRSGVRLMIALLVVALPAAILTGCDEAATGGSDAANGGLTVTLSGATEIADGSALIIEVLTQPSDWNDQDAEAIGHGPVTGGAASAQAMVPNTSTPWIGAGGTTYDVYVYIDDVDGNSRLDPGEWKYADNPITYTQDGDHVVPTTPAEYEEWTLIVF